MHRRGGTLAAVGVLQCDAADELKVAAGQLQGHDAAACHEPVLRPWGTCDGVDIGEAAHSARASAGKVCAKAGRNSMPGNKLLCRFSKSAVPPTASRTGEPKNMEATEAASPVEPWARLGGAPESPFPKAGTAACSSCPAD